jgi:hypothetical protein
MPSIVLPSVVLPNVVQPNVLAPKVEKKSLIITKIVNWLGNNPQPLR